MQLRPLDFKDLKRLLSQVEKPGRYTGGEYGCLIKEGILRVALAYPDLYEIGMSNNAIKILYSRLNKIEGVVVERVFAPALDCEDVLTKLNLPLFSLETHLPLTCFDLVAFSVGYELNATTVLQILSCAQLPLHAEQRSSRDPLVIAGGPALTNPLPWLRFFDAIFIGEAEGWVEEIFTKAVILKKHQAGREDLKQLFSLDPHVMVAGKTEVRRRIWTGFGRTIEEINFPVPNIKIAHDHGSCEIMRGCPNSCRFCNAGYFYRPCRLKNKELIWYEVFQLVFKYGFREISLASLSSGDYPEIRELLTELNNSFSDWGVSFSLPSLKIDSLALELFQKLNPVRKSGLTFAVESPNPLAQVKLNKLVPQEKVLALLQQAKSLGWRQAKFYFMLGLPGYLENDESDEIIVYLREISKYSKMFIHVNIGTFVPKPHTPLQWCGQLSEREALTRIIKISKALPRRFFKLTYHKPFQSFLEGLIARGDSKIAEVIEKAFKRGARFDAWEEHIKIDVWKNILSSFDFDLEGEVCKPKDFKDTLPWQSIKIGITNKYLQTEYTKMQEAQLSEFCKTDCPNLCGVCNTNIKFNSEPLIGLKQINLMEKEKIKLQEKIRLFKVQPIVRVLFGFVKTDKAIYYSHLNTVDIFEKALQRAGFYCKLTEGFNPKPLLEFASPLALGFESQFEIAQVRLFNYLDEKDFIKRMNASLPQGFFVFRAKQLFDYGEGEKRKSLMSIHWGDDLVLMFNDFLPAKIFEYQKYFCFFKIDNNKHRIILRQQSSSSWTVKRLLEELFGNNFLVYCRVKKIMTLCKGEDSRVGSYFKFYK